MVKSVILRFGKTGLKMCPIIAEEAGMDVVCTEEGKVAVDAPFVFRWGCTADVLQRQKVVNKIDAIHTTTDKGGFRKMMTDAGIAPKTWTKLETFRKEPLFPVLVRPIFHERSNEIYKCDDAFDVADAFKKINGEYYISEFIPKTNEYRLFICNGRVVWGIEKTPKDKKAVSWGCVQDGDFEYLGWEEWPVEVVKVAIEAMKMSGLNFGAVDVITDKNGKAYVLEINTAPYLTAYYAKAIGKVFKWIVENTRDNLPVKEFKNWRDYIHPAISAEARV